MTPFADSSQGGRYDLSATTMAHHQRALPYGVSYAALPGREVIIDRFGACNRWRRETSARMFLEYARKAPSVETVLGVGFSDAELWRLVELTLAGRLQEEPA